MSPRASRVPRVDIPAELRDFLDSLDRKIPNTKNNATAAPAVTDDGEHGYQIGSRWYDLTNDAEYVCLDTTTGAAVWKKTTP
jgi:hypothetical protein